MVRSRPSKLAAFTGSSGHSFHPPPPSRQERVGSTDRCCHRDAGPKVTAIDKATLVVYALMLCVGGWVFTSTVWPEPSPVIHTQRESGTHVTLVVVAPTSQPSKEMVTVVHEATNAVGRAARDAGMLFSTIGVSDDWSVERGLGLLSTFGHFDEVIVGRNWFNSGIMLFVDALGGPQAVPQIVVVRQEKVIRKGSWRYGPMEELARAVGQGGMLAWAAGGFPVEAIGREQP